MDIEQLKLVLETLQGLGHETSNLTIIWLSLKYGTHVFGALLTVGVIVYVAQLVYKVATSGADEFLCEMRDKLRIGCAGSLSDGERRRTMQAIRDLVNQHIQRKHE